MTSILKITLINPGMFLVTIPKLFELMTKTRSNWLLIKLIKLLTEMTKAEERLIPKLSAKFKEMLSKRQAKSIEFELIKAVIGSRLSQDPELFAIMRHNLLTQFLNSPDPNLSYLGLDALLQLLKLQKERKIQDPDLELLEKDERQAVVNLFNSPDQCIQAKSLSLMRQTVNQSNIVDFVNDLIKKTLLRFDNSHRKITMDPSHKLSICSTILDVCISNDY